jgi:putative membrane-bound dehydrogenase-like protein
MWRWFAVALFGFLLGMPTGRTSSQAQDAPESFPRVPPTAAGETGGSFHVQQGFRMDLLAAEPLTADPVAIAYDEDGRAWVVEMSDYPYTDKSTDVPFQERTTDLPLGRVRILEDEDGDGDFDKSEVFARELSWPTGIALYDGGAFVAGTPDIWHLKDTDGDRKADVRQKVFTGFRKFNVQAVINNLAWGPDNKIYGAGASNGGTIKNLARPNDPPATLSRSDFCFDPKTLEFELISGGARFGNSFDDWGNRFLCNIRNPAQHVVLPARYLARNPFLPVASALHDVAPAGDTLHVYRTSPPEPWRVARARRWSAEREKSYPRSETAAEGYFTSSSGVTIYRGAAYPKEFHHNIFVGEVAGNLIHRQTMEADGVTFRSERADLNVEFVASDDNWFRPVNFVNAPDGTLHVLDMYRETIEHPWSIPDDLKALVDLESGRDRGRIYRLTPPGFEVPKSPRLGIASTAELVATLESPNSWWRETAQRLLYEQQDASAVEPLRKLLRTSDVPLARMHAMYCLSGMNALTDDDMLIGLADSSGGVREHSVRLAEPRLKPSRLLLERVAALASDPEIRVRFQVAFSLGEVSDPLAAEGLMTIIRHDASDPWMRVAALTSLIEDADQVLRRLLPDSELAINPEGLPILRQLAVVVGARNETKEIEPTLSALVSLPPEKNSRVVQTAVILGLGDGLKRARQSLGDLASDVDSPAGKLINALLENAAQIALDADLPVPARQSAVELLSYGTYRQAKTALIALLDARQPKELQLAAVRSLAGFADPEVTSAVLQSWRSYSPALKNEALEALLARADRTPTVFDAIERGEVAASEVSSARRALLLTHADAQIRSRAQSLLGATAPGPRSEVIAHYRSALAMAADRTRGRKVFERECSTCHRLEDKGHDIGPSLTTIRHRTPEEVMTHILDPNREVAPDFTQYVIVTDDGRVTTGVIAGETAASITLRRAENVTEEILRQNIDEIANTGKSLMPEGLEQKITAQEMADLLQYLLGPTSSATR